jgi:hypothetical protein
LADEPGSLEKAVLSVAMAEFPLSVRALIPENRPGFQQNVRTFLTWGRLAANPLNVHNLSAKRVTAVAARR